MCDAKLTMTNYVSVFNTYKKNKKESDSNIYIIQPVSHA